MTPGEDKPGAGRPDPAPSAAATRHDEHRPAPARTDASPEVRPSYGPMAPSLPRHAETGAESQTASTDPPPPPPGANIPYGDVPGEELVVAQMIQLRESGLGYLAIAMELNARDIPTRYGRNWRSATVRWALRRYRPDLCPPRELPPPVPRPLAAQHHRDRDRLRKRRTAHA